MSFDLSSTATLKQASEAGYTFEPVYPGTDDGIGATITVRGPESGPIRAMVDRHLRQARARELAAKKRGGDVAADVSVDEIEGQTLEMALTYTMAWSGFERDGVALPCTPDNVRAVYVDHPWLKLQVLKEAQDLGNFVRRSSTPSSSTQKPSSAST
jgi:hypothetical protein